MSLAAHNNYYYAPDVTHLGLANCLEYGTLDLVSMRLVSACEEHTLSL